MHQTKCKASDCKKVLGEGRREHQSKVGEIDKSRSHLNTHWRNDAFKDDYSAEHIKDYIRNTLGVKRKIQNDAVLMCSAIIDLPVDYKGDPKEFFESARHQLTNFWCDGKEERVIQAEVHYDEKTPHMHFAYIPITENKKGEPALSARKLVNIHKLKQWHPWMEKHMSEELKRTVKLTLTDEEREKREDEYTDSLPEFKDRKDRMKKLEAESKERADKIIKDAQDKASKIVSEASKEAEAMKARYDAAKDDIEALERGLRDLKKNIDDSIPPLRYKPEELNEEFKIFRRMKTADAYEKANLKRKQDKIEEARKKREEGVKHLELQKRERVQEALRRSDRHQDEQSSDITLSLQR